MEAGDREKGLKVARGGLLFFLKEAREWGKEAILKKEAEKKRTENAQTYKRWKMLPFIL